MLYRGFSYVHSRLIMGLQAKIAHLEKELDRIDGEEAEQVDVPTPLSSVEADVKAYFAAERKAGTRQTVFEELRKLVLEYGR